MQFRKVAVPLLPILTKTPLVVRDEECLFSAEIDPRVVTAGLALALRLGLDPRVGLC